MSDDYKGYSNQQLYEAVAQYGGYRPAARELGVAESSIRRRLKDFAPDIPDHAFVPDTAELPSTHIGEDGVDTVDFWAEQKEFGKTVQRFILTSAQNNVSVHQGFLRNLEALAKDVDAKLLISYCVYDRAGYTGIVRNKGSRGRKQNEVWWDKAVRPYACNTRARLHKRLAFCGELDLLATTKNPLSGMESYCGRSSIIVPHNRFALKCVPSRKHNMPKEMHTTGS